MIGQRQKDEIEEAMLISNAKVEPLGGLFERLNLLNGLLLNLQNQLKMSRFTITQAIEKNNFDLTNLYAGFNLPIRDLALLPGRKFVTGIYITGSYVSQGEDYINVIDLLLSREAIWVTSQAYEAFETFLLDQYAYFLLANPKSADTGKLEKEKCHLDKKHLTPDNLDFWLSFARLAKYNCLDILAKFRSYSPELVDIEMTNSYQIDLSQWSEVVTEVRHSATHSNMIIKANRMRGWSLEKVAILRAFFPGKPAPKGYMLNLTVENACSNLEVFGSYGCIIYRLLNGVSSRIEDIWKYGK